MGCFVPLEFSTFLIKKLDLVYTAPRTQITWAIIDFHNMVLVQMPKNQFKDHASNKAECK